MSPVFACANAGVQLKSASRVNKKATNPCRPNQ